MLDYQNLTFNNGVTIPNFGLGVFLSEVGETTTNAVEWALEAGYRHIDTAKAYGNEANVAEGIRRSGVRREDIFITTKCAVPNIEEEKALDSFNESLELLDTDYVDLYLLHWPAKNYEAAYEVLIKLYEEKKIRAIGVSNFQVHHLENLEAHGYMTPAANQIELHPAFQNREVSDYCKAHNILVEDWSPLGGQSHLLLDNPVLKAIGEKYGKSAAQVIIRWHMQIGHVVIPKSVHKERIIENADVFDFALTDEDMSAIAGLDTGVRAYWDPERFGTK